MSENNTNDSPMILELKAIIADLPAMASKLPGLHAIIKYVGKVVRRQDDLDNRLKVLEASMSPNEGSKD